MRHAQAERNSDPGASEAAMKVAALAARADELRTRMRESHLANFRTEAKRRWALPHRIADTCCVMSCACAARARIPTGQFLHGGGAPQWALFCVS